MEKTDALLEIRYLKEDYGSADVLRDASLTVSCGKAVVAIGPSGCGESTLLRCINGLEPIQSGEILLGGQVLTDGTAKWSRVRQKIGMVLQSYELFPHMTVMENVLLGPLKVQGRKREGAEKVAETLLERVGLLKRKSPFPRQLPGGQKQRIVIVYTLMMQPEIMLFNEVTAALDSEMVREVFDVMLELTKGGMTMVIITHEMQFVRVIADRVIFIDAGEIVESGEPEKFFTESKTERFQRLSNISTFEQLERGIIDEKRNQDSTACTRIDIVRWPVYGLLFE